MGIKSIGIARVYLEEFREAIKSVPYGLVKTLATFSLIGLLVSCGGGGGSENEPPDSPSSSSDLKNTISYPSFPTMVKLVSVISTDVGAITVDWLPAEDTQTSHSNMIYTIHVSEKADFIPNQTTAIKTVTGAISITVNGLKVATRYYVAVVAKDESGNESWSNQLNVVTVSTISSRTGAVVHAQKDSAVKSVTDTQVIFDEASGVPEVGEIIVGAKNGGYLRKVTEVTTNNGLVTVQTDSASLNEVFDEFEFSTSVKFGDYTNQSLSTKSNLALPAGIIATGTNALHWPSGLTLIDNAPAVQKLTPSLSLVAKSVQGNASVEADKQTVYWEGNGVSKAFVSAPKYSYVQPDDLLGFTLEASIVSAFAENQISSELNSKICKIELSEFTHQDSSKDDLPKPTGGIFGWVNPVDDKISADYYFSWRPTAAHVHESLPYYAIFWVFISDNCSAATSSFKEYLNSEKVLLVSVPIYVKKGQSPDISDQKETIEFTGDEETIEFTGDVNITDVVTVNFEPNFDLSAKIGLSGITPALKSAKIAVTSDMSLINELTITADAEGKINTIEEDLFVSKKFTRVFPVLGIPILVSGEFRVKIKVEGEATGALSLKETIEFSLTGTELGMVYSDSLGWDTIGHKGNPTYEFELRGEGTAKAHIKLTLIPDFQLHFYESGSGRILLEPYVYGDAAIQGQFVYRDSNGQTGSNADYWFDELVAGAGMEMKLYAGLHILDHNIASYPKNVTIDQVSQFQSIQIIDKTPIWSLPTLVATQSAANDALDSRSILITGVSTDIPFPFSQSSASLNSFERWTTPKILENELLLEDDRAILQSLTIEGNNSTNVVPGKYHFIYTQPGNYKVRLFGYSEAGPFFQQMTELDILLTDTDSDGMIDQWETEYGVQNPANDLDGDGLSNLQEFLLGANPNIKDNPSSEAFDITISSVACSAPIVGRVMTCTILGTNLPELTQFEASNCNQSPMTAVAGGSVTQRQFICTPSTAGLPVEVSYAVPDFVGPLPFIQPVVATLGYILNDRVLTLSEREGNWEIYSVSLDGADSINLTDDPDHDRLPSLSPDRGRIAFVSDRDGNNEIYVMTSDGENPTRLTNNTADDATPVWSPDGKKIAFVSERDGNYEIYIMDADGQNLLRLTDSSADDTFPAWSPDGKKIIFVSERDGNEEIYIKNADGTGDALNLTDNSASDTIPNFSPDGAWISFVSDRDGTYDLWVMDTNGGNLRKISTGTDNVVGWYAWSPDGTQIAFDSQTDGDYEIYVTNFDGTNLRQLTTNSAIDQFATWFWDGNKIVFISDRDGSNQIYVMDPDGGNPINISNDTSTVALPMASPVYQTGGGCFIATAAYGSYLEPEVMVLRELRDEYLLTNDVGEAFVMYYYKWSPPVADVIAEHESLRLFVRISLTPLVYAVKYPAVSSALLMLLMFAFIFYLRAYKKKTVMQ